MKDIKQSNTPSVGHITISPMSNQTTSRSPKIVRKLHNTAAYVALVILTGMAFIGANTYIDHGQWFSWLAFVIAIGALVEKIHGAFK